MTRLHRGTLRVAAVLSASIAATVAATAPAAANLPVVANTNIGITYTDSAFKVCASGNVDDGTNTIGQWVFEVDGARSDGSVIHATILGAGATYSEPCYVVPRYGTANGAFATTLTFVGAGTSIVPDVVGVAGGEGSWNPTSANAFST